MKDNKKVPNKVADDAKEQLEKLQKKADEKDCPFC